MQNLFPATLRGIAISAFVNLKSLVRVLSAQLSFPPDQVVCSARLPDDALGISKHISATPCGNSMMLSDQLAQVASRKSQRLNLLTNHLAENVIRHSRLASHLIAQLCRDSMRQL
jgi:hypothetical protein